MAWKLTKPQRAMLERVAICNVSCADNYLPAAKIVELGLARWEAGRFSSWLVITEEGRQALAAAEGEGH